VEKTWANALAAADQPTDPNSGAEAPKAKSGDAKLLSIRPEFAAAGGDVGGYNAFWLDPGTHILEVDGQFRTSILTTPNGLPPPRKDGAPARLTRARGPANFDSYESRSLGERCIMGFGRNAGPPMLSNGFYNNDYEILQTPNAVVIDARRGPWSPRRRAAGRSRRRATPSPGPRALQVRNVLARRSPNASPQSSLPPPGPASRIRDIPGPDRDPSRGRLERRHDVADRDCNRLIKDGVAPLWSTGWPGFPSAVRLNLS
jgi:hypothetical protein